MELQSRVLLLKMNPFNKVLSVDENLVNFVKNSYGKTDETIAEDIAILREWCQKQAHFPSEIDDEWLKRILMRNKFRIERTKNKLEAYFTLKHFNSEWFDLENFHPGSESYQNVVKSCYLYTCSKPTPQGERVFIFGFRDENPENFNFQDMIKLFYIMCEIASNYDFALSDRLICNESNVKFGHFLKMDPVHVMKAVTFWQEVFSSRVSGMEFIKAPAFLEVLIKLVGKVLKDGKVRVYENLEVLHEKLPKEYLPEEFGGTDGKIQELQGVICMASLYLQRYYIYEIYLQTLGWLRLKRIGIGL